MPKKQINRQSMLTRLTIIDSLIRDGKFPNSKKILKHHDLTGCCKRTILRDIDYLRDSLNAPIEYDRARKGYYYTDPNWKFLGVSVRESDLFALLIAKQAVAQYRGTPLADELNAIFKRLSEVLDGDIAVNPGNVSDHISFGPLPTMAVHPEAWNNVLRGLTLRRKIEITYQGILDKEPQKRVVRPYHMLNLQNAWYLLAGNEKKSADFRQFNMGRLLSVRVLDHTCKIPKSFNIQAILENTFGQFTDKGKKETVSIRIDKELVPWIEDRIWHPKQKIKNHADGSVVISFPVGRGGPLPFHHIIRWILSFGKHATVLKPQELVDLVKEEIQEMNGIYPEGERVRNEGGKMR